jgi:NADH-quinone oxidoreductase subunit F
MDIRTLLVQATSTERAAIDDVLGPPESGWSGGEFSQLDGHVAYGGRSARARRHLLLPALHAAQSATGSVSKGALGYISERLTVPPAEAYGVATFYSLFRVGIPGERVIHVCDDVVCAGRGADQVVAQAEGESAEVVRSPCLGQCDRGPAVIYQIPGVGIVSEAPALPGELGDIGTDDLPGPIIHQDRSELRLLRRIGRVDPTSLDDYRTAGGYEALARAVETGAEGVIVELEASGLRGRGGAAFPIGTKWRGVRDAAGPEKFVIANGDESEPGTFKDRVLMEGDPFAIVEAMTVFGYATGAEKGFAYVRGEYPTAERRLRGAIEQAYEHGLLGEDVAGAGFRFDLEVRRGAGAYICGEETALFASIEGYRGEPRQKPPFPTEHGVFGKPTGINNIETLASVLEVLLGGAEAFARIGTEQSKGSKLFCVSGDVERPGVFEVPFGTTLGSLLDLAGASSSSGAILMGGAAGIFVTDHLRDTPLSFENARGADTTLGSGAIIVFDESTDFAPVLARIARFFRDESCGQCVPCRIGTVRQEEALHRISTGATFGSVEDERQRLDDLARVMTDASICGLGQTAASAVQSAIRLGLRGAPV